MQPLPAPDVVIIGGGPIGCAAALSFARTGQRVWVVEQSTDACRRRFAGEWLHPRGVDALKDITGWDALPFAHAEMPGFIVSAPGQEPVTLPYSDGRSAIGFEHADLVEALRHRLADWDNIHWLAPAHARIDDGAVRITGAVQTVVRPERVIVAAGRAAARLLGLPTARSVSMMGGIIVDVPAQDTTCHARVILGGPGPILIYRIGSGRLRVSIDLPAALRTLTRHPQLLADLVEPLLPESLANPVRHALLSGATTWAAASYRPRTHHGSFEVTALGDAAGTVHPLTAAGLTLGFLDAATVAATPFAAWCGQRLRETTVPEWLSLALYGVFSGTTTSAQQLRDGVFDHWRRSAAIRELTTSLLAVEETRPAAFAHAFTRIGAGTAVSLARRAPDPGQAIGRLAGLAPWARWPVAAALPQTVIQRRRPLTTPDAPLKLSFPLKGQTAMSPADDRRYCESALQAVSRTFSQPIRLLREPLRTSVSCGYLLCRIADTIEDHPDLDSRQRDRLFPIFLATVAGELPPDVFASAFPLDPSVDAETDLARHTARVFRVLASVPDTQQQTVRYWVAEMARGMHIYTQRRTDDGGLLSLLTMQDLERYCYFVAGTVGHMLTELFADADASIDDERRQRLTELAESFGMGLQLVNMIKDVADDLERGVVYVPRALCARAGLRPDQLIDPALRPRARAAIEPMFTRAWAMLEDAVEYTCLLPDQATDMRLFCLLPLWMAGATLHHAENHPDLLTPGRPVKISRSAVATIIAEAQRIAGDTEQIHAVWNALRSNGTTQRHAS